MRKLFYSLKAAGLIVLALMIAPGCKRDTLNSPIEKNTGKPGIISNVNVKNESGQAVLTYALPTDDDLLYVKAIYEIRPGVKREVVSSYYNNNLYLRLVLSRMLRKTAPAVMLLLFKVIFLLSFWSISPS